MQTVDLTAILIGATGLVGAALLRQLLADPRFEKVVVLGRRACGVQHEKLIEHVVDFARPDTWGAHVRGDMLFSALGTTLKVAGSKEAQYEVDHTYQLRVAEAARRNGVETYVLVSSTGASASSSIFYSRMKGELERDVTGLGFPRTRLLRPGPLDGDRTQHRSGEKWMLRLLRPLSAILPAAARPIHADRVARAGILAALDEAPGVMVLGPAELFAASREPVRCGIS